MPNGISRQGSGPDEIERILVRAIERRQPPDLDRYRRRGARSGAQRAGRILAGPRDGRPQSARVVPFECKPCAAISPEVAGKNTAADGTVCGIQLPTGLVESDRIEPIFTPATKAEIGHDENVSVETMASAVGKEVADTLQSMSLEVYRIAAEHALARGLILADTKFEWGFDQETGELLLVDEVLTPDSSRYWPRDSYRAGGPQRSFDKQFVRDWLETTGWDKASPPPRLPEDVVEKTAASMSKLSLNA